MTENISSVSELNLHPGPWERVQVGDNSLKVIATTTAWVRQRYSEQKRVRERLSGERGLSALREQNLDKPVNNGLKWNQRPQTWWWWRSRGKRWKHESIVSCVKGSQNQVREDWKILLRWGVRRWLVSRIQRMGGKGRKWWAENILEQLGREEKRNLSARWEGVRHFKKNRSCKMREVWVELIYRSQRDSHEREKEWRHGKIRSKINKQANKQNTTTTQTPEGGKGNESKTRERTASKKERAHQEMCLYTNKLLRVTIEN